MKKRYIILFVIGLFVILIVLYPTKKRKLNSMWRALLNSQKGSCKFYVKDQEGEEISESMSKYEYENRSDGFYYKEIDYGIKDDGTWEQTRTIESFESGRKIAFDGGAPAEISSGVVATPITLKRLIGGVWDELTAANVKSIREEKGDQETIYYVEYATRYKESEAGTLNSNVIFFFTKRTMTVTYSEQEKKIKKIDIAGNGVRNSTEHIPIAMQITFTVE